MKRIRKIILYVTVCCALMIALLLIGGWWFGPLFLKSQPEWQTGSVQAAIDNAPVVVQGRSEAPSEEEIVGAKLNLVTAIVQVAETNIPAVVHIEVTERQEVANPFTGFEDDPFFRRFFGFPKNMPKKFQRTLVGVGTGMIIDAEGHILTNNHVVAGATKIQVTLTGGEQYEAKVIGTDPKTDLGIIQIHAGKSLPFVTFGDSDRIRVGQWVVAIGQPENLAQSVTQGIISAKHRTGITNPTGYEDFLQTDAAINPGNSGGPLLTLRGQVIGINSAILSQSGGFEGIGFAIPANMAVHVANALIKFGKVERGWLGVNIQTVTPDLAKSFGLDRPRGALVAGVTKGGPADLAGLKQGDVILTYDGKEVENAETLRNDVANTTVGKEVPVIIWRDKEKVDKKIKIGNLDELVHIMKDTLKKRLGVEVRPVSPEEARQYGLNGEEGVVIEWVDADGPLGKEGFEVNDLILQINGHAVRSAEGLVEILSESPRDRKLLVLALDHRSGQMVQVEVQPNQ